ncbi:MAG: PAS domain S-box protein [Polyangiales bacterium]
MPDRLYDPERLRALRETGLLDSLPEAAFDRFARLAARLLRAPTALVSLVDDHRQFFKSAVGLAEPWASRRETPLSHSLCQNAVASGDALVLADTRAHELFRDHGATRELGVVAYAGVPIVTREGHALGAFCVIDTRPREWRDDELEVLRDLAAGVTAEVELRVAHRRLAASDDEQSAIIDHAPIGMAIVGLDGRFLRANRALCELLGYGRSELAAGEAHRFTSPEDREADRALAARLLAGEIPYYSRTKRYAHRSGRAVDTQVHVTLVRSADGAPAHFIAQVLDVTERHRAERALADSERRFRALATLAPVGIFETDTAGDCTFVNARWCAITGLTQEDALGAGWVRAIHPDDRARVSEEWYAAARERREFSLEYRYQSPDERVTWVLGTAAAMRDEAGAVVGYLGTALDVTDQRRVQAQLMLNERIASVGTLAAGVAHEINNPLSYVIANLDLVSEDLREFAGGSPSGRLRELDGMLVEARRGAETVRKIVRGLKTFARADDERRVPLDLTAVLDLSANMAVNEIRHRARLVKDYGPVPMVEADEARLGQVFVNLLVNAAQALPVGQADLHEIRLTARTDAAGRAEVVVSDTGAGIAPEVLGRIFDPFFTTKPVGVGTGLGLSICHTLVKSLGGEIAVESEPGRGTAFRVTLPAASVGAGVLDSSPPAQSVGAPRGAILVVDDDPYVGGALRRVFGREHDVTLAGDGREALDLLLAGSRFDAIVCDLMMPRMTGDELYAELGRVAPDQRERMIFLTGGAFTPGAAEFLAGVANHRLDKPFDIQILRAVVRDRIRASQGA